MHLLGARGCSPHAQRGKARKTGLGRAIFETDAILVNPDLQRWAQAHKDFRRKEPREVKDPSHPILMWPTKRIFSSQTLK